MELARPSIPPPTIYGASPFRYFGYHFHACPLLLLSFHRREENNCNYDILCLCNCVYICHNITTMIVNMDAVLTKIILGLGLFFLMYHIVLL